MDIDITPIDYKTVDIPCFLKFVGEELKKHISLVKNKDYKKIAFTTSNKNKFKRFFEEIIPLMFFLEREKDTFSKIKYMSGDQPEGDAVLDDSITIEITKAQNKNNYMVRQDMLNHGYAFSPKNIQNKTSTSSPTKTQPYVHTNDEHIKEEWIKHTISNTYPSLAQSCICESMGRITRSILPVSRNVCATLPRNKGKTSRYPPPVTEFIGRVWMKICLLTDSLA